MSEKGPRLAVDCVVFDAQDRLLLIRRRHPPFADGFALPGGFVEYGERVEEAARRELFEETGLRAARLSLIGVYSRPDRDPRGHTVAVAYLAETNEAGPVAGDDAAEAAFHADWRALPLAFDHAEIVADALRLREAAGGAW